MKHDLPYFSHYSTTHNEPRMQALLAEHGFEGYGRYWTLCEIIASSPNAILDISSRIIKLPVARALGLNAEEFDSFIVFLSAPDIKLIRLENCLVTTDQLQEDYQRVTKKRERDRADYNPIADPPPDLSIPVEEITFPLPENTQSRVDQSRVDQSTIDQSTKDNSSSTSKNYKDGNCSETTTNDFINKCKILGYSISRAMAEKICAGMDTSWLYGEFAYPEFVDEKVVRNDRYSGKPHDEMLRIFIGTAKRWDEHQEEFHEWRNKKIAEAAAQEERRQEEANAQEKRRRLGQARACKPEKCKCGHLLEFNGERGTCPACGSRYFFNEEKEMWEHSDPAESESLIKQFRKHLGQGETEPSQKLDEHFISIWTQNPDVFNFTATIKDKQGWEAFWKACTFSESDIDARMGNYIAGVKNGVVNRLYIPASPDRFVLDGLLSKSTEPFKKLGRHIASDNVEKDDYKQYFREE